MSERRSSESTTYKPQRNVERTMEEAQRTFEETFGRPFFPVAYSRRPEVRPWTPPTEIIDREGSYTIRMDVPGAQIESINVSATEDSIVVSGQLDASQQTQPSNYYLCEMCYGPFEREISFRQPIDPDQVQATLKDGVLTLEVPEMSRTKGKRVEVGMGSERERSQGRTEQRQPRQQMQPPTETQRQGQPQREYQQRPQGRIQPSIRQARDINTALPGQTGHFEEEYRTASDDDISRYEQSRSVWPRPQRYSYKESRDVNTFLPGQTGEIDEEYTAVHTGHASSGQGNLSGQQRRMAEQPPMQPRRQGPTPSQPQMQQPESQGRLQPAIRRDRHYAGGFPGQTGEIEEEYRTDEGSQVRQYGQAQGQWTRREPPSLQERMDVNTALPGQTGEIDEEYAAGRSREMASTAEQRPVHTPGPMQGQPYGQPQGQQQVHDRMQGYRIKYAPELPALEQPLVDYRDDETIIPVREAVSGRGAARENRSGNVQYKIPVQEGRGGESQDQTRLPQAR